MVQGNDKRGGTAQETETRRQVGHNIESLGQRNERRWFGGSELLRLLEHLTILRDRSLITGRGIQNGKIEGQKHGVRPPSRQGSFRDPPPPSFFLKSGNLLRPPPISIAKTSNILWAPFPFSMAKTVSVPPFCRCKTYLAPHPLPVL